MGKLRVSKTRCCGVLRKSTGVVCIMGFDAVLITLILLFLLRVDPFSTFLPCWLTCRIVGTLPAFVYCGARFLGAKACMITAMRWYLALSLCNWVVVIGAIPWLQFMVRPCLNPKFVGAAGVSSRAVLDSCLQLGTNSACHITPQFCSQGHMPVAEQLFCDDNLWWTAPRDATLATTVWPSHSDLKANNRQENLRICRRVAWLWEFATDPSGASGCAGDAVGHKQSVHARCGALSSQREAMWMRREGPNAMTYWMRGDHTNLGVAQESGEVVERNAPVDRVEAELESEKDGMVFVDDSYCAARLRKPVTMRCTPHLRAVVAEHEAHHAPIPWPAPPQVESLAEQAARTSDQSSQRKQRHSTLNPLLRSRTQQKALSLLESSDRHVDSSTHRHIPRSTVAHGFVQASGEVVAAARWSQDPSEEYNFDQHAATASQSFVETGFANTDGSLDESHASVESNEEEDDQLPIEVEALAEEEPLADLSDTDREAAKTCTPLCSGPLQDYLFPSAPLCALTCRDCPSCKSDSKLAREERKRWTDRFGRSLSNICASQLKLVAEKPVLAESDDGWLGELLDEPVGIREGQCEFGVGYGCYVGQQSTFWVANACEGIFDFVGKRFQCGSHKTFAVYRCGDDARSLNDQMAVRAVDQQRDTRLAKLFKWGVISFLASYALLCLHYQYTMFHFVSRDCSDFDSIMEEAEDAFKPMSDDDDDGIDLEGSNSGYRLDD